MIFGTNEIVIRKAAKEDLDDIKLLADSHRHELGFVRRSALAEAIERDELMVAQNHQQVVGFVEYHHRRDEQTTLYHIVVKFEHRRQGIGRQLVEALIHDAGERNRKFIQLKCPVDLEANKFYEQLGFLQVKTQPGKHRALAVWRLAVRSTSLGSLTTSYR